MRAFLLFLLPPLVFSGCAFNPYAGDFSCPEGFKGKCISVKGAYAESREGNDGAERPVPVAAEGCPSGDCSLKEPLGEGGAGGNPEERSYSAYRSSLYTKLGRLLREPRTPVAAPPKVMRILLLPYKGQEGEFYMMRHVYFFVDEPRWVLAEGVEALDE